MESLEDGLSFPETLMTFIFFFFFVVFESCTCIILETLYATQPTNDRNLENYWLVWSQVSSMKQLNLEAKAIDLGMANC